MQPILWFKELRRTDTARAGGQGANLGELHSAARPGAGPVHSDGAPAGVGSPAARNLRRP